MPTDASVSNRVKLFSNPPSRDESSNTPLVVLRSVIGAKEIGVLRKIAVLSICVRLVFGLD